MPSTRWKHCHRQHAFHSNSFPPNTLKEKVEILEQEYRKVLMHIREEECVFNCKVPDNCTLIWSGIGDRPYKESALYALACLSCQVSNTVAERIFSQVTCIKTNYRNKMSVKTMDEILRVCTMLSLKSGQCVHFLLTEDMLQIFNSEMYKSF